MGAADAKLLASEGAAVVIADLSEEGGRQCVEEIRAAGGHADFVRMDVRLEDDWERLMSATRDWFGPIDILVNNAGLTGAGVPDVLDVARFDQLVAVNLRGTFLGIRAAVMEMRGRGGSIVNIASTSSHQGNPGVHVGYNASKGAIRTLTKAAAAQFGPEGVRVNSVHPGLMPPMRGARAGAIHANLFSRLPLGRMGEVEEVARAVLFLASDESSYITGAELFVDGGLLAT
jgi:NAD(P)-dependent dehydrogenase (short-subunit alcohol dehydrogenase family)